MLLPERCPRIQRGCEAANICAERCTSPEAYMYCEYFYSSCGFNGRRTTIQIVHSRSISYMIEK